MTSEMIETFIAVAECGNVTEAAHRLFISQGAASMRIRQLEEELGVELFSRQRGIKSVQITPEGECFRTLARQWRSLEQQAQEIKHLLEARTLRIAAVDTINTFIFSELYASYAATHPRVKLYIQTEHSSEIHQLIEDQEIDIGFAFTLHGSKNVYSRPIYRERMAVLCQRDARFATTHDFADLSETGEIRATVSPEFEIWHKRQFPSFTTYKAAIGANSMLPSFLRDKDAWTITAESVANYLAQGDERLAAIPLGSDAPERTAYLLFYKYPRPWIQELTEAFLSAVEHVIEANPALELISSEAPNV